MLRPINFSAKLIETLSRDLHKIWGQLVRISTFPVSLMLLMGLIAPAIAAPPTSLTINQHPYPVELVENVALSDKLSNNLSATSNATHYLGKLVDYPNSWVRVSNLGGQWQGIASFDGNQYIINSSATNAFTADAVDDVQPSIAAATVGQSLTQIQPKACGTPHLHTPSFSPAQARHSAFAVAQPVALSTLCSSTINGVCLVAELEFVFDQDYVNIFASEAEALGAAESLINMVEGYYQSDLQITFEELTLQFLGNNFSDTTEGADLLDEIRTARLNGEFSFLQSDDSLLHFITGRELDGFTAGVAYVGGICNSFGIGLSSLIGDINGNLSLAVTAIVVAHELGHNFGAEHDEDPNALCGAGFIMEATVGESNTSFSACSVLDINNTISAIPDPSQCFDFAVDVGIRPALTLSTVVDDNTTFSLDYIVDTRSIFEAISEITLSGTLPAGQGQLTLVTLDGNNCALTNQGQSYQCVLTNPPAVSALQVSAIAPNGTSNFAHTALVTASSEVQDVNAVNDTLQTAVTVVIATPPFDPSNFTGRQGDTHEVNLSWIDNSNNEEEFVILRRLVGSTTFAEIARVGTDVTSYTDTTSEPGNDYEYQLFATNIIGDSATILSNQVSVQQVVSNSSNTTSGGGGTFGWPLIIVAGLCALLRRRALLRRPAFIGIT